MNCIIITSRKTTAGMLQHHISTVPHLNLFTVCEDLATANQLESHTRIDLAFIDIDTKGKDLPEGLAHLQERCHIIITAASGAHALDAFDLGATDYLLMPFTFDRFLKAVDKVKHVLAPVTPVLPAGDSATYFFVKSDNRFEKIDTKSILYIEGLQNYITIQTETKKVITYSSLKSIESYLSEKDFLRVQKSFIVSISKIDRIDSDDVVIGKTSIPISRAIKGEVLKTILNDRLYKYQC